MDDELVIANRVHQLTFGVGIHALHVDALFGQQRMEIFAAIGGDLRRHVGTANKLITVASMVRVNGDADR